MPDAAQAYPQQYEYFHPNYRHARAVVRTWARGVCQGCGYERAEEAHHVDLRYPPAVTITPDRLAVFCPLCHRVITLLRVFRSVGGDPEQFLALVAADLRKAGDSVPRTGRPRHIAAPVRDGRERVDGPSEIPSFSNRHSWAAVAFQPPSRIRLESLTDRWRTVN